MNWLDALARRLGTAPARTRRFRPSLESLDRRDVPALVAPTSSIAGYVYCDADCDGVKDAGEAGIAGVTINLTGTDAWGRPVSLTTTTDANGAYSFTQDEFGAGLLPGTYTVTEVQPAGLTDGTDTRGTPASGTVENDKFVDVNLGTQTTGVNAVNYNFGELCKPTPPPPKSSLGGYAYCDADNDGKKDSGEPGIKGVKVTLTGTTAGGSVTRVAYTDSSGKYQFNDLLAGTYTIKETQPSGYLDGKDTQGTPGTGTVGNDIFSTVTLAAGVDGRNNNFGERKDSKYGCDPCKPSYGCGDKWDNDCGQWWGHAKCDTGRDDDCRDDDKWGKDDDDKWGKDGDKRGDDDKWCKDGDDDKWSDRCGDKDDKDDKGGKDRDDRKHGSKC